MPWTLQTRHQNQLSLRLQLHPSPGYPFSLLLELEYHVGREGLTVTTRGAVAGAGPHPLRDRLPSLSDGRARDRRRRDPARAGAPHARRGRPWPSHRGPHPVEGTDWDFTTARFVGPVVLDTAFTTLDRDADGLARATLEAPRGVGGAALWVDDAFPYLMVYTGDTLGEVQRRRRAVAIEPMTCPPNALRTGTDVIALEPGQEWSARGGSSPGDSEGVVAGRVVAVTGSSSGIGAATARRLRRRGGRRPRQLGPLRRAGRGRRRLAARRASTCRATSRKRACPSGSSQRHSSAGAVSTRS